MFQGFADQTADFLWGIRLNNERPWFQDHKGQYQEYVQKPLRALGDEMLDWFLDQCPGMHMTLHLSRIYRDARRLFGRGPFKDHMWFSIQSGDKWNDAPCFYFEIGPEGYSYGMGYFAQSPALAQQFRREADRDPAVFTRLAQGLGAQTAFYLGGESYARPKGHAGQPTEAWYNRKSWHISCDRAYDPLCTTRELVDLLKEGFAFLMPYYQLALRAYQRAD